MIHSIHLIFFLEHNMIALSMVTNEKVRQIFVWSMYIQITILILKAQLAKDFIYESWERILITVFLSMGCTFLNTVFTYAIYKILTLSERMIYLEL